MVQTVKQAMTLGAYAGTVVLPLARAYGDERTAALVAGLVGELWAGLPLVHPRSYADRAIGLNQHEVTATARRCPDGGCASETPQDIVPDMLDMVRTLWQLARTGTAVELAGVTRFRLSEIAAGLDHSFAVRHGVPAHTRPGPFEAVVAECLQIVAAQCAPGAVRALGDEDLYEHGVAIGEHLVECLEQGSTCALMTRPQVESLAAQLRSLLAASGFSIVPDDQSHHPGVLVEVVDDLELWHRHVCLHWHLGESLRSRCEIAVNAGDYSAEPLRRSGQIREVVGRSLLELVRAAGFEARTDEHLGPHEIIVTRLNAPEELAAFVGVGS